MLLFLVAIKSKYKPDYVVHIGDELDFHATSFHNHDPRLLSSEEELNKSKEILKEFGKIFPKMTLLESNHGSMLIRKMKHHGLPVSALKSYGDILETPKGWNWVKSLTLNCGGRNVYFCHGKSAVPGKISQNMGMCTVQGHYHSNFYIYYWANTMSTFFDMNVSCLIDTKSLAFEYNGDDLKRPIIGCGLVLNGFPKLITMEDL